jgi:hypothetical protein
MIGFVIGLILGWIFCSLAIGANRNDYTNKIAFLKTEINNLTKGATK